MAEEDTTRSMSDDGPDAAPVVRIGNATELADEIVRRTRTRWILPWVAVGFVLLLVSVLQVAHGYRDRQDRADDEAWEKQARSTSQLVTGDGYEVTQIQCALGDDSASYSGRITNTGNASRDYSLSVKLLDSDGVQIGGSGQTLTDLGSRASANFRLSGSLVRFAGGAPLKRCEFLVEPGPPGCPDVFIAGAKISEEAWSAGCRSADRKAVIASSLTCADGRKLWANSLGFGYPGEPFQTGTPDTESRHCLTGA